MLNTCQYCLYRFGKLLLDIPLQQYCAKCPVADRYSAESARMDNKPVRAVNEPLRASQTAGIDAGIVGEINEILRKD